MNAINQTTVTTSMSTTTYANPTQVPTQAPNEALAEKPKPKVVSRKHVDNPYMVEYENENGVTVYPDSLIEYVVDVIDVDGELKTIKGHKHPVHNLLYTSDGFIFDLEMYRYINPVITNKGIIPSFMRGDKPVLVNNFIAEIYKEYSKVRGANPNKYHFPDSLDGNFTNFHPSNLSIVEVDTKAQRDQMYTRWADKLAQAEAGFEFTKLDKVEFKVNGKLVDVFPQSMLAELLHTNVAVIRYYALVNATIHHADVATNRPFAMNFKFVKK